MIFSVKSINDILDNKKCQTRRLVKKGEHLADWKVETKIPTCVVNFNYVDNGLARIKWQVGKSYSVQSGRGEKGLWYCPKCKAGFDKKNNLIKSFNGNISIQMRCTHSWKPFRIKVLSIKKEKLNEISLLDAHKEGYKESKEKITGTKEIITLSAKQNFLLAFGKINNLNFSARNVREKSLFVWVIEFCIDMKKELNSLNKKLKAAEVK